jgi:hypothetical protein
MVVRMVVEVTFGVHLPRGIGLDKWYVTLNSEFL